MQRVKMVNMKWKIVVCDDVMTWRFKVHNEDDAYEMENRVRDAVYVRVLRMEEELKKIFGDSFEIYSSFDEVYCSEIEDDSDGWKWP